MKDYASRIGLTVLIERRVIRTEAEVQEFRCLGSPTVRINGLDVSPAVRGATDYGFT